MRWKKATLIFFEYKTFKQIKLVLVSFLLAVFLLEAALPAAFAQAPAGDIHPVFAMTGTVIDELAEFEYYSLRYRLQAMKEPKGRRLRFFTFQQAQASTLLGSGLITTAEYSRKSGPRDYQLRNAFAAGLVGCVLGAVGSGIELAVNAKQCLDHKRKKIDPDTARNWIVAKVRSIDKHLKQRADLVNALPDSTDKQICEVEGSLLKHLRDLGVYEFADWYADARSYQASNSVFYALNILSNTVSAVSYHYAHKAVDHDFANSAESVTALAADAVAVPSAPISALTEKWLYKRWYRKFSEKLNEKIVDVEPLIKKDMSDLSALVAQADEASLAASGNIKLRMKAYGFWSDKFDKFLGQKSRHLRHLKEVAAESVIAGPLIATTSLAEDVLGAVGYYKFKNKESTDNALQKAGSISLVTGAGASIAYTSASLWRDIKYEKKLRKEFGLPEQQLQKRLETLDQLYGFFK